MDENNFCSHSSMKKIQAIQSSRHNISAEAPLKLEESKTDDIHVSIFEKKDIPSIRFSTQNLEGFEERLQKMKITNYQSDFLNEIEKICALYKDDELKYSYQFVYFIMEEVEKFILKPKAGESKKRLVIEVCKRYFNDDEDLVMMVISLMFEKLSQVKFFKRQGYKLIRFFLSLKPRAP